MNRTLNKACIFDLVRVLIGNKLPKGYYFTMGDVLTKRIRNYPASYHTGNSKDKLPLVEEAVGYLIDPEGLAVLKYAPKELKTKLLEVEPFKIVDYRIQMDCYFWFINYFGVSHEEWLFICGADWIQYDNTMVGTANRILYMLKNPELTGQYGMNNWPNWLYEHAEVIVQDYQGLYEKIKAKQKEKNKN